jgi:hypothetical protein
MNHFDLSAHQARRLVAARQRVVKHSADLKRLGQILAARKAARLIAIGSVAK